MKKIIIFPSQYNSIKEVDEDYEKEYNIITKNFSEQDFVILFFNYDDLYVMSNTNRTLKLYQAFGEKCDNYENMVGIYRGWMLTPTQYRDFYAKLKEKGITLINTPQEYSNCHMFPYSYPKLANYTPPCKWYYKKENKKVHINWKDIKNAYSQFMIKDFVKSIKGFSFPKYFDQTYSYAELDAYLEKFIELRGDMYTGGILVKKYVDLKTLDGKTYEFRAFYINGEFVGMDNYFRCNESDLPIEFAKSMPKLSSNFYTIDFAITNNEKIIVVETGDGQVSECPKHIMYDLYNGINKFL